MDNKHFSDERGVQILLSVLKANGIKRIIASPGTTNICFVGSVQNDPFFEVYSSVDERSAAYIACGMAAESGEPVVLSCTGATASRNYYPGLTEAYYRKLPVLAVTSHQGTDRIGHLIAQNIDRRQVPNDVVKISVDVPIVNDSRDEHYATIEINKAVIELYRRGGGPAHINLHTRYSNNFSIKELPPCQVIHHYSVNDKLPDIPSGRIAVVIGSHNTFKTEESNAIDAFCAEYNAVVFCDHTSGYYGKFRVQAAALFSQQEFQSSLNDFIILIHIGEVSGDYSQGEIHAKEVWRVNPDGEIRDTYNKLTNVFEMEEAFFFRSYCQGVTGDNKVGLAEAINKELDKVRNAIPDMSLSNIWVAQQLSPCFPPNCRVHLGILNTLRTWNYFDFPSTVESFCNVGGFGIDGILSTLIGASLVDPNRLYFGIIGDLAFFYDMNVLGNRHVGNNVRILLINNGRGAEFRMYTHYWDKIFHEDADAYGAAAGHFGNMSRRLVKHYAEDLGYEYLSACTKEEFLVVSKRFLIPEVTDRPMIFEVFTNFEDERDMQTNANHSVVDKSYMAQRKVVDAVKSIIGQEGVNKIKSIMRK